LAAAALSEEGAAQTPGTTVEPDMTAEPDMTPVSRLSEPMSQLPKANAPDRDTELTQPLVPVAVIADLLPVPATALPVETATQPSKSEPQKQLTAETTPLPLAQAPTVTAAVEAVAGRGTEPPTTYKELAPGVYVPAEYVQPTQPLQPTLAAASQAVLALGTVSQSETPRYPLLQVATVTSPFGARWGRLHAGVDLGVPAGTPVVASLSGQVVSADWNGGYGNCVVLRHRDGTIQTLYGHLSRLAVQTGQMVQQGQIIGWSGSTGYSTGPHLHFELRQLTQLGWQAVDINTITAAASQSLTQGVVATAPAQPTVADVTLRVALATRAQQITVGSSAPALLTAADGSAIASLNPLQPLELVHTANGLYAGAQRLPSLLRLTPQPGGAVAVNGVWYRGTVLIADLPGGLSAINWVSLEDYLVSVVGSEAYPSWGAAALQAQAIAARSYALWYRYNPANAWYDLAAGPEYQAYEGLTKEFTTTAQAVADTQGLVLTSKGTVLQAQYAATQSISDAYHGGQGLSQWGAAALAASGYDYRTILGQFYPGAQLSRLQEGG